MSRLFLSVLLLAVVSFSSCQHEHPVVSLEYFYEQGIPEISSEWSTTDYIESINTLNRLVQSDSIALPNAGEPGYALVLKMSDGKNYFNGTWNELDFESKLQQAIALQKSLNPLVMGYAIDPKMSGGKCVNGTAMTHCQTTWLYLTDEILSLMDEFIATSPALDDVQKQGYNQMIVGLEQVLEGGLMTIATEYRLYQEEDICSLSSFYFPFLNRHQDKISAAKKAELLDEIDSKVKSHPLKCVADAL
jgi:hypothetical protein